MMNKKTVLASCVLLCAVCIAYGQQANTSAGATASGSGGSASYSVGQVVYTSIESASGTVTHGVQQPYDISVISAIKGADVITLHCEVYPNPTTDLLVLQVDTQFDDRLTATLSDENGKQLERKAIVDSITTFEMSQCAVASYYLLVSNAAGVVKQFKIVKQ